MSDIPYTLEHNAHTRPTPDNYATGACTNNTLGQDFDNLCCRLTTYEVNFPMRYVDIYMENFCALTQVEPTIHMDILQHLFNFIGRVF